MNLKELIRLFEEIYSFKFDEKSVNASGCSANIKKISTETLQQATAKFLSIKFKTKTKTDQVSMDFMVSLEYHKQSSVEADLFYRFFSEHYS